MITTKHLKLIISVFFLTVPTLIFAQKKDDPKYLQNAVPLVEGKVEFTRIIDINNTISGEKLYELVKGWVDTAYVPKDKTSKKGILYESAAENIILVRGEDKLVFKAQILSIDQAFMEYRLSINTERGKCILKFSNIRYKYQDFKTFEKAENLITDELAFNAKKNKLNRYYDKFRIFTIEDIDNITNNLKTYLSNISPNKVSSEQVNLLNDENAIVAKDKNIVSIVGKTPETKGSSNTFAGFKSLNSNEVPASFDALISQSRIIVCDKDDNKTTEYYAEWNGMGEIRKSPVSIITLYDNDKTDKTFGDNYTVYFINEAVNKDFLNELENSDISSANLSFAEKAWMIVECETAIIQNNQDTSRNAISNPWSPKSQQSKKTIMGDILNIWVK